MEDRRRGLGDVLDLALDRWKPRGERSPDAVFGAAGGIGAGGDRALVSLLTSTTGLVAMGRRDPMTRMFGTAVGADAANAIGSEARTLVALERLSLEIMAGVLRATGAAGPDDRLLVIPSPDDGRPPVLMMLSPEMADAEDSRVISDELDLPVEAMAAAMREMADPEEDSPEARSFERLEAGGPRAMAELFLVAQPEIVLTRRPRMIPLCAPSPHLKLEAGGQISTAGILCRDADGELGVTGCYHGTGPAGTAVSVELRQCQVKCANAVQDIVFIPLVDGYNQPSLVGLNGIRQDREPARAEHVRFDGATNQDRRTRVFGADAGLLRPRATVQLKLQTDPDTDQGDSGCALIDDEDRILGFAFERTAYDDYPQFTDWIWAANALRSLGLTPV